MVIRLNLLTELVTKKNITFGSYNVKNYNLTVYETMSKLFKKCSFLLIQETWMKEQAFIDQFKKDFKYSECISASKMENKEIMSGRKYGGVGICYHTNIKCAVETIPTKSKSICALKTVLGEISILLVNVYMPSTNEEEDLDEYSEILFEVSSICIRNTTDFIVMGGDWNADPVRNDRRTKLFKEFIKNENLYNALDIEISDVPYTFVSSNKDNRCYSTLDHFLISPSLKCSISEYRAEFHALNGSDHVPIVLTLDIDIQLHKTYAREHKSSVAWHKCDDVNIGAYQNRLDQLLLQIDPTNEAWSCKDRKCTKHNEFIQNKHNQIIRLWMEASNNCLPHTTTKNADRGKNIIPGWNEHVKEHKENAKMCHQNWIQNNRPRQGDIAKKKISSRLKYHYAIRYVMKENIRIRNNKMGEAIAENKDRVLWDEVSKMTKTAHSLPRMMDGKTDVNEISNIFANKYNKLYNSVSYKGRDMDLLRKDIESRIDSTCHSNHEMNNHKHTITVTEVKEAVDMLKKDKKEENGLNTNHIKHGTNRLFVMIALMFNCMLSHGLAPDELLLGTMIPLIKDSRGKKQCSDNYRALTIGTGLSKLLDIIIKNQQTDKLKTSDLQFGFKEKSSTTMCTFTVLNTIEYYKSKGSNVHVLLLDASKAFDRVNYIKLFDKMLKKGMCPLTVRLLLNMYTQQKLQVKWDNILTQQFDVTNGVRQGGVLSPLLFSIYVDDLLEKLKNNGVGCHIGHKFVGALGYADDIILLCPTADGLMKMIKICEDYANEHSILFNGKKSKYLVFGINGKYKYNPTIKVNNEIVAKCESADHLGHPLHTEKTQDALAEKEIKSLNSSFHAFSSRFSNCNVTTKNKLYHQYCSSMYGSQLWSLNSNSVEKIFSKWRKYHRIALEVPNKTHCDLLPLIADNMPLVCTLDLKFISFFKSIATSENSIVKYIAKCMLNYHTSTLCRNILHIRYKYNINLDDILTASKGKIRKIIYNKWITGIDQEYPFRASIVKDMHGIKEERYTRIYSNNECNDIIEFFCTYVNEPLN